MVIKRVHFLTAIHDLKQAPQNGFPEYAFIGRSNVGKSSLINMLANRNALAKISGKPGKTQTINYFLVNESWYMVDLPGYGWAKVSKGKKTDWNILVRNFILHRKELFNLFVLIDCRLNPQPIDVEFINWAGLNKIPLSLVFTKADKISKNVLKKNIGIYNQILSGYWTILPDVFITSAKDGRGRSDLLDFIDRINKNNMPSRNV